MSSRRGESVSFQSRQKTHAMSIVPPVFEMQPRVVGEACLSYPRVPQSRPR